MIVTITGTSGFLGGRLMTTLSEQGYKCGSLNYREYLSRSKELPIVSERAAVMVHCAGITKDASRFASDIMDVNLYGAVRLLKDAANKGYTRFIFISTAKVFGETSGEKPFNNLSKLNPVGLYAQSKAKAELCLIGISKKIGIDLVIIRPPIIYSDNLNDSFALIQKVLTLGVPLPLSGLKNKRSMVALSNVVDLVVLCTWKQEACGEVFLVSDDDDISTTKLFDKIAECYGFKFKTFYLPVGLLKFGAYLLGRKYLYNKLYSSLQLDIEFTKAKLNWLPRTTMDQELKITSRK